jgi:chemotaxis response regulator CheB
VLPSPPSGRSSLTSADTLDRRHQPRDVALRAFRAARKDRAVPPCTRTIVVAIGASAGGIDQLHLVLGLLPEGLGAVVLVAMHRPVNRVSYLCETLGSRSRMPVVEAGEGERLLAGRCYLGLPARHLGLGAGDRAALDDDPEGLWRRRTVDDLFLSVALHAGPRAIGVVLTGMLRDGAAGLGAIKAAGGRTLVQLPAEAAFPGMPRAAIDEGTVIDLVAPTAALTRAIVGFVGPSAATRAAAAPPPLHRLMWSKSFSA